MTDPRLTELIDRAFDYRGYVTLSRHDGGKLVGFVYDRSPAHVDVLDETAGRRIRLATDQIADVEFTGEDSAAKAQAIWQRKSPAREPSGASPRPGRPDRTEGGDGPVLILVALPVELRSVAGALGSRLRGAMVRGHFGHASAVGVAVGIGGGAAQVVAAERPQLVISGGFAGALDPQLLPGDLVLASSVRDETQEALAAPEPVLRAARQALAAGVPGRVAEGEILCATRVAAAAEDKRALARPGRIAVDLESWPAAHAAARAGIPWLAIRVVFDAQDTDLPAFTREVRSSYVVPALRHALRGPRAVVELARLARRAQIAGRALERALRRLGPGLASLAGVEMHP